MMSITKSSSFVCLLASLVCGWAPPPSQARDVAATLISPDVPDAQDAIDPARADYAEPDWSLLDSSGPLSGNPPQPRHRPSVAADRAAAWSSQDKADGSAALSVKQPLSPFWDARVGADMTVARQSRATTTSELLRQRFSGSGEVSESTAAGWAAMTAPGPGSIWDKTSVEARLDPTQDQRKLGTALSKTLPLGSDQYALTLQNGYNVMEQTVVPAIGSSARPTRSSEIEQSAKLSIADSGTSVIAGQTLSSADDRWLRKLGAEQKLFGGINVSGSISELPQGPANKTLTAGFKASW